MDKLAFLIQKGHNRILQLSEKKNTPNFHSINKCSDIFMFTI